MTHIIINPDECICCNLCVDLCPDLFESTDCVPNVKDVDVSNNDCANDSVDFCPTKAISIK